MFLECKLLDSSDLLVLFIFNTQVPKTEVCSAYLLNKLSQKYKKCLKMILTSKQIHFLVLPLTFT